MATRLKFLVVDRVDLVDVGANLDKRTGDGAHIMLYKRAGEAAPASEAWQMVDLAKALGASADLIAKTEYMARSFDDVLAGQKARLALDSLWDLYYAFMESAQSIFSSDEANKIGLLRESAVAFLNTFLTALPEAIEIDDEGEPGVAKVGRKISAARLSQLTEMHAKLGSLLKEVCEGDKTMKIADFAKSLGLAVADDATPEQVKKAVDEHVAARVAEAKASPADVQKALDAQRLQFDAELAKRDERIAKAEAEATQERHLRILKSFDEKARTELSGLSLQLEKAADKPESKTDAEIFKALSEAAPAEWARVEAILKGAAEAIRASVLFKEQGGAGSGATAGSAEAKILSLADERVAKGLAKTREQAVADVASMREHAALYAEYSQEMREAAKH